METWPVSYTSVEITDWKELENRTFTLERPGSNCQYILNLVKVKYTIRKNE